MVPRELAAAPNLYAIWLRRNTGDFTGCYHPKLGNFDADDLHWLDIPACTDSTIPDTPDVPAPPVIPTMVRSLDGDDILAPGLYHFKWEGVNFIISIPEGLEVETGIYDATDYEGRHETGFVFRVPGSENGLVVNAEDGEFLYMLIDGEWVWTAPDSTPSGAVGGSTENEPSAEARLLTQAALSVRTGTD